MKQSEILHQLDRSYQKLLEALEIPPSQPLAVDGTIKRFESTYAIACETIHTFYQDRLNFRHSHKRCIAEALRHGWIEDQSSWDVLMVSKSHAAFVYSELLANEVYENVKNNHQAFNTLINGFREKNIH